VRLIVLLMAGALAAPARAEVVKPLFDELEPGATAQQTYELNALSVVGEDAGPAFPTLFGGTNRWWRPVRGKFRRAVGYDPFFRALGRPDLARQHREQRLVSGIFFWGGAAVFAGGAVLLFTGLREGGFPTRARVGAGLMLGGLVENGVGGAIQPPLVSEADAVALATEYNRHLRLHLGLADHATLGLILRGPW
jgi:hypothetical protein